MFINSTTVPIITSTNPVIAAPVLKWLGFIVYLRAVSQFVQYARTQHKRKGLYLNLMGLMRYRIQPIIERIEKNIIAMRPKIARVSGSANCLYSRQAVKVSKMARMVGPNLKSISKSIDLFSLYNVGIIFSLCTTQKVQLWFHRSLASILQY